MPDTTEPPVTRLAPERSSAAAPPGWGTMLWRGARGRCPRCGVGRVFNGYLTLAEACGHCGEPIGHLRADDAPPYFTILIVGHVLVPGVLAVERAYQPPMWVHMVVWLPLFTLLCMAFLRPIKGAVVAWMMRLGIAGPPPDRGHV